MALVLSEEDVERCLGMDGCIQALREAFAGPFDLLPRWRGSPPEGKVGSFNVLAASLPALGYMGLKAYSVVRGGGVRFHVLLYSWEAGRLEAVIEANGLGALRTGAASGLATDLMARADARVMACIGAGKQAYAQVAAVAAVRPLIEVRIASRRPESRTALAALVRERLGVSAVASDSAEAAVRGADVVTVITNASSPVLFGEWLSPGTHINAAGSNAAEHAEVDAAAVLRADRIVADARAAAASESGDLIPVAGSGRLSWDRVAELADVVTGRVPGRTSADEVTLFESQGLALEDVAAAAQVLAGARRLGLGREVEIH